MYSCTKYFKKWLIFLRDVQNILKNDLNKETNDEKLINQYFFKWKGTKKNCPNFIYKGIFYDLFFVFISFSLRFFLLSQIFFFNIQIWTIVLVIDVATIPLATIPLATIPLATIPLATILLATIPLALSNGSMNTPIIWCD